MVTVGTYANSLGNEYAIDDIGIIPANPVVTTPIWEQALLGQYSPVAREGAGLYRPLVTTSFALEWRTFRGNPVGYHVVSLLAHLIVGLLLLVLLQRFVSPLAALAGALLFVVHPLHVEAVANIVGRAELYASIAVLMACILYLKGEAWGGPRRVARLGALCLLYLVGLGSKEIAVGLPALLVALELARPSRLPAVERLHRGLPVYLSLAAVLGGYLLLRTAVLGTVMGEVAAPWLRDAGVGGRLLTALAVWPQYLRLLVFPVDLVSDYAPNVLPIPTDLDTAVVTGVAILVASLALAWALRKSVRLASIGIVWFCVAVLPVSNLLFAAGLIMAERTLYLPSVGLSLAVAGLAAQIQVRAGPRTRQIALGLGVAACFLLMTRSVMRNRTWFDSFTVMNALAVEHPESFVSLRFRAIGLASAGDTEGAREAYEAALHLAPMLYGLSVEVGEFYGSRGEYGRAEEVLEEAVRIRPDAAEAYMLLSEYMIRQGRGQDGHRVALTGLARAGPRSELFALVSESYVTKRDLEGAVRARLAALGQAPDSSRDWGRLATLYEAMGRADDALAARAREAATGDG